MTTMTLPVIGPAEVAADPGAYALTACRFLEPLEFGRGAAADLELLRLLRMVTSHAVRLRWTIGGRPEFPLHTYSHLLPPTSGVTLEDLGRVVDWARDYQYGSFYYRRGPGLVSVKDVRPGQPASRMVIGDGADGFERLAESITGLVEPADEALAADAVAADLALRVGDRVLVLPFRMRHWPVPYQAV
jgi:Family of unknown function (DUF5825)